MISWVGKYAGCFRSDSTRIVVTGTSAGGQPARMSGMLTADSDIDDPSARATIGSSHHGFPPPNRPRQLARAEPERRIHPRIALFPHDG